MISVQYILTKKQREKFLKIPIDISDWDIAKYYTFTKKELKIIGNRRRQYNKIGFTLQLSALKHPGWIDKKEEFNNVFTLLKEIPGLLPQWDFNRIAPKEMLNYDNLFKYD